MYDMTLYGDPFTFTAKQEKIFQLSEHKSDTEKLQQGGTWGCYNQNAYTDSHFFIRVWFEIDHCAIYPSRGLGSHHRMFGFVHYI